MNRIFALLVLSTLMGCAVSGGDNGGDTFTIETIAGIDWQLVRLEIDGEDVMPMESSRVSFTCTPAGEVSGSASINRYSGRIVTLGSRIEIWSPLRVTRMAGPPELMAQESKFLSALPQTTQISQAERKLILENRRAGIRLEFATQPN